MEEPTKPDSGTASVPNNDSAQKTQGRGNWRGGYKGRRGNKPKQGTTIYRKPEVIQKEKFTGRSDDLEGYVYTLVSNKGGLQFTRTTEEVARYAGEKYSVVGAYVRTAILTMTQQVPVRPTAPAPQGTPPVVDPVDQAIFNEEIRQFVRNKAAIIAAMKAIYSVIWGQCSKGLRSKLKSNSSYDGISVDADSLALLKEIRSEMTGFKKRNYLPRSVHSIMREFYNLSQGKHRTNQEYYDEFNKLVAAVDECGAMVARHPTIYDEVIEEIAFDVDSATADEISQAKSTSRERYLAVAFLLGADRIRYGIMIEEIENEYLRVSTKQRRIIKGGVLPTNGGRCI
jgi:hypothetical protein